MEQKNANNVPLELSFRTRRSGRGMQIATVHLHERIRSIRRQTDFGTF